MKQKNYCPMVALALFASTVASAEVKLDAEQRESLGIETKKLAQVQIQQTYPAIAQVMDAAPLVSLLSDLRAAKSAAVASRNELERAEKLYAADANVSRKTLEAARVQSLNDAGHTNALRAQLLASWGAAVATMTESERDRLVADVLDSKAVIVRVESRKPDATLLRAGKVRLIAADESFDAQLIGQAVGGPQVIGRAYLLRVASRSLQTGQVLDVELKDSKPSMSGLLIERSAIVRYQGNDWIYLETEPNHFARRVIHPVTCTHDGCLVQKELSAGQTLVTVGTAMLLSVENSPASED